MATCNRVVAALNFLTGEASGEGIDYYHDNCDDKSIQALISDYFDGNRNEDGNLRQNSQPKYLNIEILCTTPVDVKWLMANLAVDCFP